MEDQDRGSGSRIEDQDHDQNRAPETYVCSKAMPVRNYDQLSDLLKKNGLRKKWENLSELTWQGHFSDPLPSVVS